LADRRAALSEEEATYALALFCALKGVASKQALSHLKRHLRPLLKRALREILARQDDLERLRAIDRPLQQRAQPWVAETSSAAHMRQPLHGNRE
jgi:hypothetical protein